MASGGPITVVAYLKRRSDLTPEQFWDHFKNVRAPLVAPWAAKHGFLSYSVLQIPRSSAGLASTTAGIGVIDCDLVAYHIIPSYEALAASLADPYFINVLQPDERNLYDENRQGMTAVTGGLALKIVEGGEIKIEVSEDVMNQFRTWETKVI